MRPEKLKVEFGQPEYGWLPVEITWGERVLSFDASATLSDSVSELIQALLLVTQTVDVSINWFLELLEYRFDFRTELNEEIVLSIYEFVEKRRLILLWSMQASFAEVILPFWRALQKLNPADFKEENWYPLPLEKLEKLTQLIKLRRRST